MGSIVMGMVHDADASVQPASAYLPGLLVTGWRLEVECQITRKR